MDKCNFSTICSSFSDCSAEKVFVKLKECNRDLQAHLKYRKVNLNEKLTEWQLILSRAGKVFIILVDNASLYLSVGCQVARYIMIAQDM